MLSPPQETEAYREELIMKKTDKFAHLPAVRPAQPLRYAVHMSIHTDSSHLFPCHIHHLAGAGRKTHTQSAAAAFIINTGPIPADSSATPALHCAARIGNRMHGAKLSGLASLNAVEEEGLMMSQSFTRLQSSTKLLPRMLLLALASPNTPSLARRQGGPAEPPEWLGCLHRAVPRR